MRDTVYLNADAVRTDLKRMNLTAEKVCERLGLAKNTLTNMLSSSKDGKKFMREGVARFERALFAEEGAYCIELDDMPEQEKQPEQKQADKELADAFMQLLAIDNKILVELKNMNEAMKELLMNVRGDTSTEKEYVRRIHDNVLKITEALK